MFNQYTANMTRGSTGRPLTRGFDLSNLTVAPAGEKIEYWDRQVSLQVEEITLREVIASDKLIKYNLLANIMKDEGVNLNEVVSLYACGYVKEIRVKKNRYRCYRNKYLGMQKTRSE